MNEALRDRFVCGLRSESIQRRLLTEEDLTLKRAVDLSLAMEAADENAKALKGTDQETACRSKAGYFAECYGPTSHEYPMLPLREERT